VRRSGLGGPAPVLFEQIATNRVVVAIEW